MTDMAAVIEHQLDELLAQAEPAWLDHEPEVREERAYREDDTYAHQRYAYFTKEWEKECERQARELFPEQFELPSFPSGYRPFAVTDMLADLEFLMNRESLDGPTP